MKLTTKITGALAGLAALGAVQANAAGHGVSVVI